LKINKRALVVLMSILILLFMFLMLNLNNIGRQPELYSVSNSVVSPGDTITIYGNYFGGELSKGRVYINNKMVFNDFILSWRLEKTLDQRTLFLIYTLLMMMVKRPCLIGII